MSDKSLILLHFLFTFFYKQYTDTELQKTMYEQVHTKLVQDNKDILMISWNSMQHEVSIYLMI